MEEICSRFTGCLLGGAVGDALGAPVEFMSLSQILNRYGENGIEWYDWAYGKRGGITDDTQMTLFTAEGLILHGLRYDKEPEVVAVYHSYQRWLVTQKVIDTGSLMKRFGNCSTDGVLMGYKNLHSQRAPGQSCLSALASGDMGTMENPINDSKGCGGVMRIAPAGLFLKKEKVFDTACQLAAITHGHPTGYLASGVQAQIIHEIISGRELSDGVEEAKRILLGYERHEETLHAVDRAIRAWNEGRPVTPETVENLGRGWIAEEALAIGLYCALAAGDDFAKCVRLAVNHGGDSDSTGSIAGNICGAMLGKDAIPKRFLEDLELADLIEETGQDLFERREG